MIGRISTFKSVNIITNAIVRQGNRYRQGCVSFFCAACLLKRGGGDESRDGTLEKRKGVVPRIKKREAQDAARRFASALERTRRGNFCLRRAVESGPSASDAS